MLTALFARFLLTRAGKMLPSWAWELVFIALIAGAGMLAHHVAVVKHDNGVRAEQKAVDKKALDQTVASYRAAAAKAAADDAANKKRVEQQQAQISKEQSDEYEARIAAARATADRLRQQLAHSANPSSTAKPPVPGISAPASGPAQAAPDGLSIDDRLTCTEQGIQLDELIKWVRKVAGIDPNTGAAPR